MPIPTCEKLSITILIFFTWFLVSWDFQSMLMSFRIAELQTLLASCGRSRSGRKHELLGRAISLLKTSENSAMRERVKTRILELYNQRYPSPSGGSSVQSSYSQPYLQYPAEKDEEPTYLNRSNNYKHNNSSQRWTRVLFYFKMFYYHSLLMGNVIVLHNTV